MEYREYGKKTEYPRYVLGGDVGGENTTLAVAGVHGKKPELICSWKYKSRELKSIAQALETPLGLWEGKIESICLGAAGPCEAGKIKLTNLNLELDAEEIRKETGIKTTLINDLQALAYGIPLLDGKDLMQVKKGVGKGVKVVVAAGTGLGKTMIVDGRPQPSEGGHADFPVHDEFDRKLSEYIKKGRESPASWEEILSGKGIERIYDFLEKEKLDAAEISKRRKEDPASMETFRKYAAYFGRCAKNYVLETLATGGLYVGGGIAAKNPEIFEFPGFMQEFMLAEKQKKILEETPIYVVLNYEVSVYGACYAAAI